ncbi:MAG TPA: hypothetical protein PKD86_02750 [Gemmatales bacterium]|nr:hypothetical protein [Gemmatales bacterium]HMP58250.1 hypothetical protein [Gemmatales bacterium]
MVWTDLRKQGRLYLLLFTLLPLMLPGCSEPPQPTGTEPASAELFAVGVAYRRFCQQYGRPPMQAGDLRPFLGDTPAGQDAADHLILGDIVFHFGVSVTDMQRQSGASATILGYQRAVPQVGGWVLLGDTGVRKMSAEEFSTTPKAKRWEDKPLSTDPESTPPTTPTISRPKV